MRLKRKRLNLWLHKPKRIRIDSPVHAGVCKTPKTPCRPKSVYSGYQLGKRSKRKLCFENSLLINDNATGVGNVNDNINDSIGYI